MPKYTVISIYYRPTMTLKNVDKRLLGNFFYKTVNSRNLDNF